MEIIALSDLMQDYEKAAEWFTRAAEQAYAKADYQLGKLYRDGLGVTASEIESAKWYQKAAEGGYSRAQYRLGRLYLDGQGVQPDENLACEWFEKSAMQGYVKAQYILGVCYARGIGLRKDYIMSHAWLSLASQSGDDFVEKVFNKVQKKVNADEKVQANRLAGEWQAVYKTKSITQASQ